MLTLIKHRVNTLAQLSDVDPAWGVEIDLRADPSRRGRLYLHHDAWEKGVEFETWLRAFKKRKIRGPIVLNTKEDGLEEQVLSCLKRHGVTRFFFLDTAFPTLVKWALKKKTPDFSVRYSVYEKKENLRAFRGHTKWVWVDCFDGKPVGIKAIQSLKRNFKICLVSPELQGAPVETIARFRRLRAVADAVCTKRPDLWR